MDYRSFGHYNGKTDMAEYKHGTMNTEVQEKTFSGFVTFTIRSAITIIVALILLAMING